MTQEDKQLLLKDLCARLPYGVKIQTWYGDIITSDLNTFPYSTEEMDKEGMWDQLDNFKPYLRPMSSMTDEEKKELKEEHKKDEKIYAEVLEKISKGDESARGTAIPHFAADWLNAHHFDHRGLIPKRLALEAKEGMYKTE